MIPDVGQGRRTAAGCWIMHRHQHDAGHDQRNNRHDFDNGKPEFKLTKQFYGGNIQAEKHHNTEQGAHPYRKSWKPELKVGADRHHVGNAGNDPTEPVGPAGEIACPGAEQVSSKIAERFIFQIRQQQFAHCPHHEKQHKTDDHINEDNRRPGEADGFT